MDEDIPVIYGIDFQARCLVAQAAETDAIRFLIGTQSLKHENQVQLIDFDEDTNVIFRTVYLHSSGEIWNLSSCPFDAQLLATCYNEVSEDKSKLSSRASLWRLPESSSTERPPSDEPQNPVTIPKLEKLLDFREADNTDVVGVIFEPVSSRNQILTLKLNGLTLWDIDSALPSLNVKANIPVEGKGHIRVVGAKWSPHHSNSVIGVCTETSVRGIDLRDNKISFTIDNPHGYMTRQLDFNQNKPYDVATCGDDCTVKLWDTRNTSSSLRVLADHSHWVWCVKYNPFHDQLILSSSSDSRVILASIASLSSEPIVHSLEDEPGSQDPKEILPDGVINTYEEHEDSVYALDWSAADPWTFASLSYDGRLVINRVPRSVKYKILL
ncbi:hypothetical protein RvY_10099 [Ramazzottius varieornatus]|uniref:EIPR1-like beta-propeller domain-containing protein n=1 Tax=Ramazzottius varieornatus TaxID=947166 RepID=A0A1D1VBN5_RAMVA|nr:hypothetical protein RvY_10099 [Ramazzottius varieornatus]